MINERLTLSPAADHLWQRRKHKRDAKRKLITLNRAERLATRAEQTERRTDLSPVRLNGHLTRLRDQYRRVTGIDMDVRDLVRPLLEELTQTGECSVDQLLSDFGLRVRNACGVDNEDDG